MPASTTTTPGGTCPTTGLKIHRSAETLIKANAVVAVVFLAVGGLFGLTVALTVVGYVETAWMAIAVMAIGNALGAFVTGGFAVNHMDVAPKHAGTLMGITNTAGTIPGIIGVFVSGLILEATGSWVLVFQLAAGVTLFGLVFFLLFASGKRLLD